MGVKLIYTFFLSGILLFSCNNETESSVAKLEKKENPQSTTTLFTEISSDESKITFGNKVPETPQLNILMYEYLHNGAGVAIGDLNNDGLSDIYFVGNFGANHCYLNKGNFEFENITKKAGLEGKMGWGTGVTMVDINNDGYLDIYLCKSGKTEDQQRRNELYINQKDLTFKEEGAKYGVDDPGYSMQATFFDFDRDGDLDLYIINHPVEKHNRPTKEMREVRNDLASDKLLENVNGQFKDVSAEAGILNNSVSYGLGIAVSDLNNDGYPDLYVCNDYLEHDYLYMNNGDKTFTESLKEHTKHSSNFSMGVDVADFNNDGHMDIMVADMAAEDNFRSKTNMSGMNPEKFNQAVEDGFHYQYMINTLQLNNGSDGFSEISQLANVSNTDWSWAPLFADFDNDGFKDLFVSNGLRKEARNNDFVKKKKDLLLQMEGKSAQEQMGIIKKILDLMPQEKILNYFFKNNGDLTFSKTTAEWGIITPTFSNGAAYGDLDNDGDLDLVVNNIDALATVMRNNSSNSNYLKIKLAEQPNNSFGIGARVRITQGEHVQENELFHSRGYISAVEPILHFGLASSDPIDKVEVLWSDGNVQVLNSTKVNQLLDIKYEAKGSRDFHHVMDKNYERLTSPYYVHQENQFDDFEREVLLPHKMSTLGPALAVGDINNDGLDDFFIGGASGQKGAIFAQLNGGGFEEIKQSFSDEICEDVDALFYDLDQDGDLDLYVVSGGNEFEIGSVNYQDRLYINQGNGKFNKSIDLLPTMTMSGGCVEASDIDGDGYPELFVGGRQTPGRYPYQAVSVILKFDGKKYINKTQELAPDIENIGMVTDALWTDYNQDGKTDLIVVGEWMPITFFANIEGRFVKEEIVDKSNGWWFTIEQADIDQDGDLDFILGNLGLNYKYKASQDEPFEIFSTDFDKNGKNDIVLGYHANGTTYPLRGRQCSSQQIPDIKKKFPNYESFGKASLIDVYGKDNLDNSLSYKAYTYASSILLNEGNGKFNLKALPNEAQLSSVNGIVVNDSKTQPTTLMLAGNWYKAEVETPRNDASHGVALKYQGDSFNSIGTLGLNDDVRNIKKIIVNGQEAVIAAVNDGKIQIVKLK